MASELLSNSYKPGNDEIADLSREVGIQVRETVETIITRSQVYAGDDALAAAIVVSAQTAGLLLSCVKNRTERRLLHRELESIVKQSMSAGIAERQLVSTG